MRGAKPVKRRIIAVDPKYHSLTIAKFINKVMLKGKKNTARGLVYRGLDALEQSTHRPAAEAFDVAINNAAPNVEVKSKRIGGATYQVPTEVRPDRRITLAMRWVIQAARNRQGKPMDVLLGEELLEAYNATGVAVRKREETHRMAEANKAFAHFARF